MGVDLSGCRNCLMVAKVVMGLRYRFVILGIFFHEICPVVFINIYL